MKKVLIALVEIAIIGLMIWVVVFRLLRSCSQFAF